MRGGAHTAAPALREWLTDKSALRRFQKNSKEIDPAFVVVIGSVLLPKATASPARVVMDTLAPAWRHPSDSDFVSSPVPADGLHTGFGIGEGSRKDRTIWDVFQEERAERPVPPRNGPGPTSVRRSERRPTL
jgi:hypothetical protein